MFLLRVLLLAGAGGEPLATAVVAGVVCDLIILVRAKLFETFRLHTVPPIVSVTLPKISGFVKLLFQFF